MSVTNKAKGVKYSFSGHESFPCKSLWLKKGYDFVMAAQKNGQYEKCSVHEADGAGGRITLFGKRKESFRNAA